MSVVFGLSALLKIHRSSSVYRSFSALVALILFSHSYHTFFDCSDVYRSFAADGCIFHLETLARSLGDTRVEKEYLLALVDLGRTALIAGLWSMQRYDDTVLGLHFRGFETAYIHPSGRARRQVEILRVQDIC